MTQIPVVLPRLGAANTCANCVYWDPQDEEQTQGWCRERAPVTLTAGGWAIWPLCRPVDWCGEWAEVPTS